jgi:outer membrane protein TolC
MSPAREAVEGCQNRFNAGSTSNFDVLRAQVALANGQPPLIQARNDYRIAIEQLRQVLGFASDSWGGCRQRSRNSLEQPGRSASL